MKDMLKDVATSTQFHVGASVLRARDSMDDGTPIELTVTLDNDKVCWVTGEGEVQDRVDDGPGYPTLHSDEESVWHLTSFAPLSVDVGSVTAFTLLISR